MLKTGIYTLKYLKDQKKRHGFLGGEKKVSITLYDQILKESNRDELAERILLHFSDERGAYRRTYAKRFEAFDAFASKEMQTHFKTKGALLVKDVGVSDGRTSCDFFQHLASFFKELSFEALDYDPHVYILEKGKIKATLSSQGRLLEIVYPPFVFNVIKRDSYRHYPLNFFIKELVKKLYITPLLKSYQEGKIKARELLLFAPQALALAEKDKRFKLGQHNLLTPFKEPNKTDVIRAMNVLNPDYFKEGEMKRVIENLHLALKEGGWLITGSNQEAGSLVEGGIYQKTSKGFKRIGQSGKGSPIEKELLSFEKS